MRKIHSIRREKRAKPRKDVENSDKNVVYVYSFLCIKSDLPLTENNSYKDHLDKQQGREAGSWGRSGAAVQNKTIN